MKKKFLILFGTLLLVFVLGLSTTSLGFTLADFEQKINEATSQYLTYFINDGNSGHVPAFKYFIDSTFWANNKNTYATKFADYNSFMFTTLADQNVVSVNLFLFNDLNFNVTFANLTRSTKNNQTFNIALIDPTTYPNVKRIRFYTPRGNNNGFYLDSEYNVRIPSNTHNDQCILWTTGTITNVNNYIVFGGNIPIYRQLTFNQTFTNTTTYQGYSTHYTIGSPYLTNIIKIGEVIPNDAVYYEVRMRDTDTGIVIGSYYNNLTNGDTFPNNALYGNGNNIYLYTRYITYNHVYDIEITYIYEIYGQEQYDHNYLVFFPQR